VDLRQRRGTGNASDRKADCRRSGKLSGASLLEG
jgi:hypothetical protein